MKKTFGWLIAIILVAYAVVELELLSRTINPGTMGEQFGLTIGQIVFFWLGYSFFTRKYKPVSSKNSWKLRTIIALILINHLLYNVGREISKTLAYEHVQAILVFDALKIIFLSFSVYLAWTLNRKDVGDGRTFGLRLITILQLSIIIISFIIGFQGGLARNQSLMDEYSSLVDTFNSDAEKLSEKLALLEKVIDQQDWTRYHDEALIAINLYAQYVRSSKNLSNFLEQNKDNLLRLDMNVQDNVEMMSDEIEGAEENIKIVKENLAFIESQK